MESILYENKGTTDLVFELERLISCAVEDGLSNNNPIEFSYNLGSEGYAITVGENTINVVHNNMVINPLFKLFINGVKVNGALSEEFITDISEKVIDTYRKRVREEKTRQTCLEVLNSWK